MLQVYKDAIKSLSLKQLYQEDFRLTMDSHRLERRFPEQSELCNKKRKLVEQEIHTRYSQTAEKQRG